MTAESEGLSCSVQTRLLQRAKRLGVDPNSPIVKGKTVALYRIGERRLDEIAPTTFSSLGLQERGDLQRLLRERIDMISPGSLVLAEEFGDWEESRRRIDLLALDPDGTLVVIELKRTEDGGHMELQALRYAAMVSTLTLDQAVDAHTRFCSRLGIEGSPRERIESFLDAGAGDADGAMFGHEIRIVLVSADFSRELTTTVLWLNERDLDIRCIRLTPYQRDQEILLDVQQIIPLPEAEEYQVRVRERAAAERAARSGREDQHFRFWSGLLKKALARTSLHEPVSPSQTNWVARINHGLYWSYATSRGRGRVELYLGRQSRAENKAIFDELQAASAEIESAFGDALSWERLPQKSASRIAYVLDHDGSTEDEGSWDEIQDQMISAMIRLERALGPFVQKYRDGAKAQ